MSITYAGVPLILESDALDRAKAVLSLDDLKDWAYRTWPGRLASLGWPWSTAGERPVFNRLTWPTEASRFAYGYFLTDDAGLSVLRPQAYAGGLLMALPFKMDDGQASITTNLFMLPPRPLSQNNTGGDMWLLTLVDVRLFWWDLAASIACTAGTTTWAQLFAAYAAALGVTITVDPIPAAYVNPPADFNTAFELLPPQIDSACRSIGMKFVANRDGTFNAVSASPGQTAATRFAANIGLNPIAAGGLIDLVTPADATSDFAGVVSQSVAVVFPGATSTGAPTGVNVNTTVTLASLIATTLPQFAGAATSPKVSLVYSSLLSGSNNAAQVTSYANQTATDFYLWQVARPDVAYSGVCPWLPCGFEDRIEWNHGPEEIWTRVQRGPWNDRVENLLAFGTDGSLNVNNTIINQTITYSGDTFNYTTTTNTYNIASGATVAFVGIDYTSVLTFNTLQVEFLSASYVTFLGFLSITADLYYPWQTAAAWTTDQDPWTPANKGAYWRIPINASINLKGITTTVTPQAGGTADGEYLTLVNVGTNTGTIKNSAATTASLGILTPNGGDVAWPSGFTAIFDYDNTSSRWRLIGGTVLPAVTTKGDMLQYDGTTWQRVAVGTDGTVWTANAASSTGAKWAAASGGGFTVPTPYNNASLNYSLTNAFADSGASITLPDIGTYLIWAQVNFNMSNATAGLCKLRNTTSAADIGTIGEFSNTAAGTTPGTVTLVGEVTTTSINNVVHIFAEFTGAVGGTITGATMTALRGS